MNLSSFQKPSRYINSEINSIHKEAPVKVALAFPDVYEIGMSHLGLRILYKIINDIPFASAERVFYPWLDLEAEMKAKGIPLSSLESNRPLKDFDILGFSLQYELSYTTVLNMLYFGGIPLRAEERNNSSSTYYPIVIAGGPCTVNPGPLSPFIDAFLIGDGEEAIRDILDTFYRWKMDGDSKRESILLALSEIEGMYVPSVQRSAENSKLKTQSSKLIKRRFIKSLDDTTYPYSPIVPYTSIVHDRANIEVSRGCSMGCRFCQAGITYRPVRERSPEKVLEIAENSLRNTGYEEVAFTSLSAGDYSCLLQVVKEFNKRFSKDKIALSLPSLRVGSINCELLKEIRSVRKTGFTIAPEAGSERLRKVINKGFSEDEYERALKALFEEGWHNLKLYFMIGLPRERDEDIEAIPEMVMKALKIAKQHTKRFVNINVGVSPFVPKPHTPFQWYGQGPPDELKKKMNYLRDVLTKKGFKVKGHDVEMSLLEAAFSRGDESLAPLIEKAWLSGCRLDGWSKVFDSEKWKRAMDLTGIDAAGFAKKTYEESDILPWNNIDIGLTKEFLWREKQKALSGDITPDCRKICQNCGLGCETSVTSHQSSVISNEQSGVKKRFQTHDFTLDYRLKKRFKPVRIRVEFSKTGRLRYLSHLELMAVLHRAIRRAGVPLVYSEGYHPSPKISFGPPLGVGIGGLSEYFDMEIVPPFDIVINRRRLNNTLPEGICVKDMAVIPPKAKSLSGFITRYGYEIKGRDLSHINRFLSEEEINIQRERYVMNLRAMVEEARQIDEETIYLVVVDQGDKKVRLGELLPKIFNVPLEELDIMRVALYGWDGGWVKPLERSSQWAVKS
ncbi:MAG: TIGR03960 family B12-binding radical SAM protein [Thermodesulfovibrionales bacterium]|nr:TIGR03960 family B12-binding radical SAM protein [Thermodesulfovibrionales bacterium]